MSLPEHIKIRHSSRARRVALRLDPIERVFTLVVPKGMSMRRAQAFAEGQESWMQEKLAELAPKITFEDSVIVPIFGVRTQITIHHESTLKVTKCILEDGILHVRTNKNDPSSRIIRFLKALVKDELTILSKDKAAQIGKEIARVSVGDSKTRWGSCSSSNSIAYSWRLVFAPPEALDYVVAHEVAHLQHLDHSKAFWSLCRELSGNYVEGKYWMDNHGAELMRYG